MCTQISRKSYIDRGTKSDFTVLKYVACFMRQIKPGQEGRMLVLSSERKISIF